MTRLRQLKDRFLVSSSSRRIASGVSWTLLGTLVWRGLSMVCTIVMARLLGKVAFGELAMVRSTVDVFALFAGFRLGSTVTKHVAEFRATDRERAGRILKVTLSVGIASCAVMALACAVSSSWVALDVLGHPGMARPLALGSLLLFFTVYGLISEAALAGFENFRSIAVVNSWRGAITLLLGIPATWLWGVSGAILSLSASAAVALSVSSRYVWRDARRAGIQIRVSWADFKAELPVLWRFTLPLVADGLLLSGSMWLGRVILSREDDGFAQMGIFGAADQWRTAILFIPAVMGRVLLPVLSETFGSSPKGEFARSLDVQIRVSWSVALPLTVIVVSLSEFLSALVGKDYRGSAEVMQVLMFSVFFFCVNTVEKQAMIATGRVRTSLILTAGWAAILLILSAWLAPLYGALGFALANLLAYMALVVAQLAVTELWLAAGLMRKHGWLYACCLAILCLSFVSHQELSGMPLYASDGVLIVTSLVPLVHLLRGRHRPVAQ